jgi:hypothetical protein
LRQQDLNLWLGISQFLFRFLVFFPNFEAASSLAVYYGWKMGFKQAHVNFHLRDPNRMTNVKCHPLSPIKPRMLTKLPSRTGANTQHRSGL